MRYAGFWIRFVAVLVDAIIIAIIEAPLVLMSGPFVFFMSIGVAWLYEAAFTSGGWQGTPGKRLLGLRVTDLEGRRISFLRATGRHFAKIISALLLMIGYIMAGITERKQALHDMIAGTLVHRAGGQSGSVVSGAYADDLTAPVAPVAFGAFRWVLAGFDSVGNVVRLTFDEADRKLGREGLILGRDPGCDLVISDNTVSRNHARFYLNQQDVWIEDLGSANGIHLAGRLLPKNGKSLLPVGATLVLGEVELTAAKF